ncbi:MAG: LCP family protein [Clostridia bacterium]|nr:LCP family protein [Clostridia bacterium]
MRRWVWILTLLMVTTALVRGSFPLLRQAETAPEPADTAAPPTPEASPFSLLCLFTDGGVSTGMHILQFEASSVTVTAIPANVRLAVGTVFTTADRLYSEGRLSVLRDVLQKELEITIDNYVILSYDSYIELTQTYVGGITLTLAEDIPIPFIGDTLILFAGRQTLTPAQVVAYWRQSGDTCETAQRQAEVLSVFLEEWLSATHRADWDALFADLTNTAVTDWRIDRYSVQRRTLWTLSQREEPLSVPFSLPAGELVGEGRDRRFEFAD